MKKMLNFMILLILAVSVVLLFHLAWNSTREERELWKSGVITDGYLSEMTDGSEESIIDYTNWLIRMDEAYIGDDGQLYWTDSHYERLTN